MSKKISEMSDGLILELFMSIDPLNRARQKFSSWCAKIEQAGQQRKPLGSVEMRRMEFEAVEAILEAYKS